MSKAFRCDVCDCLIEDEVATLHPNELDGYGDRCSVRIKVSISGRGNTEVCRKCVAIEAATFLAHK